MNPRNLRCTTGVVAGAVACLVMAMAMTSTVYAKNKEKLPEVSKDGLHLLKNTKVRVAYAKPGLTLDKYTKVKILDCCVDFKKNYERDYNLDEVGLQGRVTDKDLVHMKQRLADEFKEVFTKELQTKGGYQVVDDVGPDHPAVAASLSNLASLFKAQGEYAQAEPLFKRALAINEKVLGPDNPIVAASLNNLASLFKAQGEYAQAEPLYKRSLAIFYKTLGPNHPAVGMALNNLALLYKAQGQYAQAEPLYERALAISEKTLGPDHLAVAASLINLAALYRATKRYKEAETLDKRAARIRAIQR